MQYCSVEKKVAQIDTKAVIRTTVSIDTQVLPHIAVNDFLKCRINHLQTASFLRSLAVKQYRCLTDSINLIVRPLSTFANSLTIANNYKKITQHQTSIYQNVLKQLLRQQNL